MRTLFLCCLIAGIAFAAKAQESDQSLPSHNIFKFAPDIRGYGLKFGVEHFNKEFSHSMSFLVAGTWVGGNPDKFLAYHHRKGVAAEAQYRRYFVPMKTRTSKRGNPVSRGPYLMGFGKGAYEKHIDAGSDYLYNNGVPTFTNAFKTESDYLNFSTGLCLGYQVKFMYVMVIDVSAGAAVQVSNIHSLGNVVNHPEYSVVPKLSLLFGFSL